VDAAVCQTVPHNKAKNVSKDLKGIFPLHTDIESKPEESPIQKICVCMWLLKDNEKQKIL
jgi:hypothetical protein